MGHETAVSATRPKIRSAVGTRLDTCTYTMIKLTTVSTKASHRRFEQPRHGLSQQRVTLGGLNPAIILE
jgi:hypothetical protein